MDAGNSYYEKGEEIIPPLSKIILRACLKTSC